MSGNQILIMAVVWNVVMCSLFVYVMIVDQKKIEKLKNRIKELETPNQ